MRPTSVTKYVTVHNPNIPLSETPDLVVTEVSLTDFEKRYLRISLWTLSAITLTLLCYVWLAVLQRNTNELTAKSLKEMQHANDLAKKSFDLSHTPWIGIESITIKDDVTSKSMGISYKLRNQSDTPALDVVMSCFSIDAKILTNKGGYHEMDAAFGKIGEKWIIPGDQTLAPHGATTANLEDAFLKFPQDYEDFKNQKVIFVTVITYRDVFNKKIRFQCVQKYYNGTITVAHTKLDLEQTD